MKNSVSLTFEPLLQRFEDKLAFIITLTYQKRIEQLAFAVSEVVDLTCLLADKIPQLRKTDWFQAIVVDSESFISSPENESQKINILHDSYFYNLKHLARYRREVNAKTLSNRIVIEDLFSTAVKISSIEKNFQSLTLISKSAAKFFENENKALAEIFERVRVIAFDCECYSLLSLEVSWEIICSLISKIQYCCDLVKEKLRPAFTELEQIVLAIDSAINEIFEMITIDLEVSYSLDNVNFKYRVHFENNSIFV